MSSREGVGSLVCGVAAMGLSLLDVRIQWVGAVVGVAGVLLARRARNACTTDDILITLGRWVSVVGIAMSLLVYVLWAATNLVALLS